MFNCPVRFASGIDQDRDRRCYNCGKEDHQARVCPEVVRSEVTPCQNCGNTGHMTRKCPNPLKLDLREFVIIFKKIFLVKGELSRRIRNHIPSPRTVEEVYREDQEHLSLYQTVGEEDEKCVVTGQPLTDIAILE